MEQSEFEHFSRIGTLGVVRSVTEICEKYREEIPGELFEHLGRLEDAYGSGDDEIRNATSYRQVQTMVEAIRKEIVEKSREHGELPGRPK